MDKRPPKVIFPVRLPTTIVDRIKALAELDGLTPSEVVRTMIVAALKEAR